VVVDPGGRYNPTRNGAVDCSGDNKHTAECGEGSVLDEDGGYEAKQRQHREYPRDQNVSLARGKMIFAEPDMNRGSLAHYQRDDGVEQDANGIPQGSLEVEEEDAWTERGRKAGFNSPFHLAGNRKKGSRKKLRRAGEHASEERNEIRTANYSSGPVQLGPCKAGIFWLMIGYFGASSMLICVQ
jgi:hypothetical protein